MINMVGFGNSGAFPGDGMNRERFRISYAWKAEGYELRDSVWLLTA